MKQYKIASLGGGHVVLKKDNTLELGVKGTDNGLVSHDETFAGIDLNNKLFYNVKGTSVKTGLENSNIELGETGKSKMSNLLTHNGYMLQTVIATDQNGETMIFYKKIKDNNVTEIYTPINIFHPLEQGSTITVDANGTDILIQTNVKSKKVFEFNIGATK